MLSNSFQSIFISTISSAFHSKMASPRLKSGARPRKLLLSATGRLFLCLLFREQSRGGNALSFLRKESCAKKGMDGAVQKGSFCSLAYWKTSSWAAFCVSRTSPPAAQSAAGGLHLPYGKCYVRKVFSEGLEHCSHHLAGTIYALLLRSFSSLREEKRVPLSRHSRTQTVISPRPRLAQAKYGIKVRGAGAVVKAGRVV